MAIANVGRRTAPFSITTRKWRSYRMELASLFAKRKIAPILLLLPVAILLSFPACGDGMDTKVTATSPPEIGPTQPGTSNATSESEGQGTGTPSPPAITQRPSPTRASEFNVTSAPAQQPMPTTFPPLPLHSPPPDIVPPIYLAQDLVSVDTGSGHTCGLRRDGAAFCWGRDWEGQSSEPEGKFTAIAVARHYSCGALSRGGVQCWGAVPDAVRESLVEAKKPYLSIGAGKYHLCGLKEDRTVECLSNKSGEDHHLDRSPEGEFSSLDVGYGHVCGVRIDGQLICWGGEYGEGVVVKPGEMFASVSAGHEGYSCGVGTDGAVSCWQYRSGTFGDELAPEGSFSAISVAGNQACGIRADGTLLCWNEILSDWEYWGFGLPPEGLFTNVSVGRNHACASRNDGTVVCWGEGLGAMPPGGYGIDEIGTVYSVSAVSDDSVITYVAVGDHNSCQWQSAGPQQATFNFCWGRTDVEIGESTGPTYSSISSGYLHTCAVSTDGEAVCWGSGQSNGGGFLGSSSSGKSRLPDLRRNQNEPPPGDFLDVAAGNFHTCGLRTDRSVVCWGRSGYGQATSPGGEFAAISAGDNHTCGLRPTGQAVCWGDLDYRGTRPGPPEDEFQDIASGERSTCGIRSNGSVECWGNAIPSPTGDFESFEIGGHDACGISTALAVICQSWTGSQHTVSWVGPLTTISLGGNHRCGIRTDGSLLCWGGRPALITPPSGKFTAVSAGTDHTCALRVSGAAVCWGLGTEYGQTTPPGSSAWDPSASRRTGTGRVSIPKGKPTFAIPLFYEPTVSLPGTQEPSEVEAPSCGRLCSESFWAGEISLESVRAELDKDHDLSLADDEGATALHWAVASRAGAEVINLLLDREADPAARVIDGSPVLTVAVGAGNSLEVVQALLDRGADPNPEKNNYGNTPLSLAVSLPADFISPATIRLLLENGADATEKYEDEGLTILHMYYLFLYENSNSGNDVAADPEVVALLLEHGANVSVVPDAEFILGVPVLITALVLAPDPESVRLMLEYGADPSTSIEGQVSALHLSVSTGNPEIIRLLLEYGADPSDEDEDGNTPLHLVSSGQKFAGASQAQAEIISVLLAHGADPTAMNSRGETACELSGSKDENVRALLCQ